MMIKINIYRSAGKWYAAQWLDGEYDSCDLVDVDDDASEDDVRSELLSHAPIDDVVTIDRVQDATT